MGSSSTPAAIAEAEKTAADAKTNESAATGASNPPPAQPGADNTTNETPGTGAGTEAPRSGPVLDDLHKLLDDTKAATNQAQVHDLIEKIRQWVKENL